MKIFNKIATVPVAVILIGGVAVYATSNKNGGG